MTIFCMQMRYVNEAEFFFFSLSDINNKIRDMKGKPRKLEFFHLVLPTGCATLQHNENDSTSTPIFVRERIILLILVYHSSFSGRENLWYGRNYAVYL